MLKELLHKYTKFIFNKEISYRTTARDIGSKSSLE
jgi:hypothetical protein